MYCWERIQVIQNILQKLEFKVTVTKNKVQKLISKDQKLYILTNFYSMCRKPEYFTCRLN